MVSGFRINVGQQRIFVVMCHHITQSRYKYQHDREDTGAMVCACAYWWLIISTAEFVAVPFPAASCGES